MKHCVVTKSAWTLEWFALIEGLLLRHRMAYKMLRYSILHTIEICENGMQRIWPRMIEGKAMETSIFL